jgi:hypothetical protein
MVQPSPGAQALIRESDRRCANGEQIARIICSPRRDNGCNVRTYARSGIQMSAESERTDAEGSDVSGGGVARVVTPIHERTPG